VSEGEVVEAVASLLALAANLKNPVDVFSNFFLFLGLHVALQVLLPRVNMRETLQVVDVDGVWEVEMI
jgi:hypothetical protein